jgi:hypothetical protein
MKSHIEQLSGGLETATSMLLFSTQIQQGLADMKNHPADPIVLYL